MTEWPNKGFERAANSVAGTQPGMFSLRVQALPRHLHSPGMGRPDYAAAGVSELRKENDDVGEGGRVR